MLTGDIILMVIFKAVDVKFTVDPHETMVLQE